MEYMASRLAHRHPTMGFAELRYRIPSWQRHEMCVADAGTAMERLVAAGAGEIILLGFSLGGAVATQVADHPHVRTVIGCAPWLPRELPAAPMVGRELHVLHGTLDPLLGTPGVSRDESRQGFDRIIAAGANGTYSTIRYGMHAIAFRLPIGGCVPAPRARAWVDGVDAHLPAV